MTTQPNNPGTPPQEPPQDVFPGQEELDSYLEDVGDSETPETPPAQPSQPTQPKVESVDDRLTKALATIEALSSEVRSLREAPLQPGTRETADVLPEVETILGVPIPKDRTKRPVKLTQQDLVAMKWNEDPTSALETLGNVLVHYVLGAVPMLVQEQIVQHSRATNDRQSKRTRYNELFPDLVEFEDLGEIVERRLRAEGVHKRLAGDDYMKQVGTEVRKRIAGMRGQTLEDYEAGIGSATPVTQVRQPASRTTPRTITSPQGTRSTRTPTADAQQREMQDLY